MSIDGIVLEVYVLLIIEPVQSSTAATKLKLSLLHYKLIFIAFHANFLGYHLALYQIFHRIRLQLFWPHVTSYIKKMSVISPS